LRNIPLSRPDVGPLEQKYVQDALTSNRLAMGPYLERFEKAIAQQCGTRYAIAVSSGTAALHLVIRGLGLGAGDEVITTPFSFVASSNVLLYENVHVRFIDIDPSTYHLNPARAEQAITPATRALLGVDIFGLPADWPAFTQVANTHDLFLIDDACHALGAEIAGQPIGNWGDAAAFGFYPNKQMTLGEGGCITTNSKDLAMLARSLRNQGRTMDRRMEHTQLGYNYRLNELSAALGCAQIERLGTLLRQRRKVAACYNEALDDLREDILLPVSLSHATRSWFVYVIQLRDHYTLGARDLLMQRLRKQGIECAPYFPSIHLQPYYRQRFGFKPGDFPVCEAVSARTLAVPFYGTLPHEDVIHVAKTLKKELISLPKIDSTVSFNM